MVVLFRSTPGQYKGSDYETKRNLIKSRNTQRNRAKRLRKQMDILEAQKEELQQQVAETQMQLLAYQQATPEEHPDPDLESGIPNNSPLTELRIPNHQFTATMIRLCINLAKQIGFRPARRALQLIFAALHITLKVPSHDVMRQWVLRVGLGELQDTFNKDQETLWMADHSSQIGPEKVLLIIGMELKNLPEPGQTLCLDDVKVLAIVPGQKWKKEDVAREYQKLADQIGAPRYLLCDGATELREPAEKLEKDGQKTVVLGDLKHHAANVLEKQIGRSERFKAFISQVGLTRNRVQQTELSHFAPSPLKQKSRFMNLGPLLNWAAMALYHLDTPGSESRKGITADRMHEKLGWLEEYRDDLKLWGACQELINKTLSFINHEGLSQGTSERLWRHLAASTEASWSYHDTFHQVFLGLIEFVQQSEQKLRAGERAWLSTEILESLFGRFKRLEGQHHKGGFTGLLAALPTLCGRLDASKVRQRLLEVGTKQLKQWLESTMGRTLTSRRTEAYAELQHAMNVQF
jgi:hypothetical protein